MKFKVEQSVFESGLQLPATVAQQGEAGKLQPAFRHVMISASSEGVVEIKATDSYNSVVTRVEADVEEEGVAVVPAGRFASLVKSFPPVELAVSTTDSNTLQVASERSRFEFPLFPEEEFPEVELPADDIYHSFEGDVLAAIIEKVSFSMANDKGRPHLESVFFMVSDGVARGVATDGHRLALAEYPYEGTFSAEEGVLIPKKGAGEISKLLAQTTDPIQLGLDDRTLAVKTSTTVLAVKLLDATFVPYERVIPKYEDNILVVPIKPLTEALKRIRSFSDKGEAGKSMGVILSMAEGEELLLKGVDLSQGSAEEVVPGEYRGASLEIPVNLSFLMEIVSKVDSDEAILSFATENPEVAPILIKPMEDPSFLSVLMPLKL